MKATEAHKMTDDEIRIELDRLQKQLYTLKSQAVTEKLEDPSQLTKARRDIARLLTERRGREIAKQSEAK